MPFTLDEYQIGQLYATYRKSRELTGPTSAVQVLDNKPFSDERGTGQYTLKRIHMGDKLPRWLDACLPAAYKVIDEISLNMYPVCQTGTVQFWVIFRVCAQKVLHKQNDN